MAPDSSSLNDLRIDRSRAPQRGGRGAWIAAALILLALAGAAAWWFNRPGIPMVRTAVVQGGSGGGGTLLNASGYVTARREATVSSKVTAKVVEVLVEEGMQVKEGQVLARLDSSNVEKSLQLAKSQVDVAHKALGETRANLDQAEREWRRLSQLATDRIVSVSELDASASAKDALAARLERQRADVSVAESEVALWKQEMEDRTIRAPFSGMVTSKNAQPGEMISPISAGGGFTRTGICTIVDMASLEIEVDVNESYINRVAAGQPVEATLDAYSDWRIPAEVIAIVPTADRQKATVKVRVGFAELDPRILPEMSVKVAFRRNAGDRSEGRPATVPAEAVRRHEGRDVIWIVEDGRVERRAVTVGVRRGAETAITAGVSGGERVVIDGAAELSDGERVNEATP